MPFFECGQNSRTPVFVSLKSVTEDGSYNLSTALANNGIDKTKLTRDSFKVVVTYAYAQGHGDGWPGIETYPSVTAYNPNTGYITISGLYAGKSSGGESIRIVLNASIYTVKLE